jgi:hypothetical protein
MKKVHYIDVSNCSIHDAYIKIGRPDLAALYKQHQFIWNIGITLVIMTIVLNAIALFLS